METPKPQPRTPIGARLKEFQAAEVERILSSCTRCGKCYEVCPMAQYSRAPAADGKAVVPGVLAVLQLPDEQLPDALRLAHEVRMRWCGPEVEVEGIGVLRNSVADDPAFAR